jgi:aspartyl-tRNA(Asn)/glutamyl-tRNA(Gln) amidotransferase subunit C
MSVDAADVRRIAHLARISLDESRVEPMRGEINGILGWIEQLEEVNVEGVEPMTSVTPMKLRMRKDEVTDGGDPARVLSNAPSADDNFFVVPKVVE